MFNLLQMSGFQKYIVNREGPVFLTYISYFKNRLVGKLSVILFISEAYVMVKKGLNNLPVECRVYCSSSNPYITGSLLQEYYN